jgi:hypothetical protein
MDTRSHDVYMSLGYAPYARGAMEGQAMGDRQNLTNITVKKTK